MYLLILDSNNYNLIFRSYHISQDKEPILNIKHFHINGKLLNPKKYQIGIYEDSGLIFSIVHEYNLILNVEKVNEIALMNVAKKIFSLFNKNDLRNFNSLGSYYIAQKIENTLFPLSIPINVIGQSKSGKSTISNLFFSYSRISAVQNHHIPYKRTFNGKFIKLKEPSDPYGPMGIKSFKSESNFLLVLDSTKIHFNIFQKVFLDENETQNKNILIIANKQDLPDAMSPEEIEKELGFPTVGFSAIAPDAPERLEKIISDFLKD